MMKTNESATLSISGKANENHPNNNIEIEYTTKTTPFITSFKGEFTDLKSGYHKHYGSYPADGKTRTIELSKKRKVRVKANLVNSNGSFKD